MTSNGFPNMDILLTDLLTSTPFPLEKLDKLVHDLHTGTAEQRTFSQHVLVQFKEADSSWSKVDFIITNTKNQETKFFALQALEHTIGKRWKVLPREQCDGIKNFIISIIISLTETLEHISTNKVYLSKLNLILVKILKHDWPQHWPTALADIVGAAKNGEAICQNNLEILRLLSEEIFEFSEDSMVQSKVKHLKQSMCDQFSQVFELCYYVLENSENQTLVQTCLKTLLKFTAWIPYGYFFETELIAKLTTRLLPYHLFRNLTLACITEIAAIESDKNETEKYQEKFLVLYVETMKVIGEIIPYENVDLRDAYKKGTDSEQKLVQNLALFLSTFMTTHKHFVMRPHAKSDEIKKGLMYLVKISYVDDVEVFKICLDFWHQFAQNLYHTQSLQMRGNGWGNWGAPTESDVTMYSALLSDVRTMMIFKMAKPEEVLVAVNEQGDVVREVIKDTDSHVIYQTCKKTLVFLTHLDSKNTEDIMQHKLSCQVDDSEWSWDNLNHLCWSIGSISGAMDEENERRFLVNVIKDLLGLCEQKRGKDNKAIIASNIMYVVGQYPRFLRAHWKFLKTVVNKLFEFMHEPHDGVQDMACDTFLKISQKCKRHFVQIQTGERVPFIEEILENTVQTVNDLQAHQVQSFYEAVGYMIAAQTDLGKQADLIRKYMLLPNQVWSNMIEQAGLNQNTYLHSQETLRQLITILKTNIRACKSLGHSYVTQLSEIFMDMMSIYGMLGQYIISAYARDPNSLREHVVKDMRTVKKETLNLITLWITNSKDNRILRQDIVPALLEPILTDYTNCPPVAREAEVIDCAKSILVKLGEAADEYVNIMFQALFESTLSMINTSDAEFPEHRMAFFKFLSAINTHAFRAMLALNPDQFKLVLDAIIWGMKQMMQECKETSLTILEQLLANVTNTDLVNYDQSQNFYKTYYVFILEHVFEVSTNILHAKANLQQHARLLAYMMKIVDNKGTENSSRPIISSTLSPNPKENESNSQYIYEHVANLLKRQFGSAVTDVQIRVFVEGIFAYYNDLGDFIAHLRDFLIQMRELRGEDCQDLFLEERMQEIKSKKESQEKIEQEKLSNIPGMMNPYSEETAKLNGSGLQVM